MLDFLMSFSLTYSYTCNMLTISMITVI